MNYYGSKELAAAFRTVRKNTVQIAEEIPENKYDFKPSPEARSVAQTLSHLAVAPQFFTYVHVNKIIDMQSVNFQEVFGPLMAEEQKPRTKAELVELLKTEGDKFASFLEGMSESDLAEHVNMSPMAGGGSKSRFEMLLSPKEHEMHHRAQLMTIQRMIGQVPHLTRQMQERMAQMQQQAQPAGQR
ncbi:MAG TPA: DinB family protein [Vicinamibacterales bacterium]|nr:DinB family protein [Vicinamibacterales bacterium]